MNRYSSGFKLLLIATGLTVSNFPVLAKDSACGPNEAGLTEPMENRTVLYSSSDRFQSKQIGFIILGSKDSPVSVHTSSSLIGMSVEDAEHLFGKKKANESPFKIWGFTAADKSKKSMYNLDTKFTSGKLTAYRLSGAGIENPNWVTN